MNTYCVDFETTYSKEVNIERFGAANYLSHPKTDVYLVSIYGPDLQFVGDPKEAPWDRIKGHRIIAHNYAFDGAVLDRLGLDFGPDFNCSSNLCRYLGAPGSLKAAAKKLLGREISKEIRDSMKGQQFSGLLEFEKQAVRDYANVDAKTAWDLWEKYEADWPDHEKELSRHTLRMCREGIGVDLHLLDQQKQSANLLMEEALKSIPWAYHHPALSTKRAAERCAMVGIPAPASFAEDNPHCLVWEEKYGEIYPFVHGMRTFRKANFLLEKLSAIERRIMPSGRLHYDLKYFGAHTGRWSGAGGVNLQNFPRSSFGGIDLRNLLVPGAGKKFIIADLSQIEPRVLAYLAGDTELLEAVKQGFSIYEAHAISSGSWNGNQGTLKKSDPNLYSMCKARVLGLGYGLGGSKFARVAKEMAGVSLSDFASKQAVYNYRRTNPKIPALWARLDRALGAALLEGEFTMGLPSGRKMRYENLQRIGDAVLFRLPNGMEVSTWGGKLTENLVSGTARDIFGDCLLRLDRAGVHVAFHVHDEVVCEVDEGVQPGEILEHLTVTPDWLPGCPIAAEASECRRYCK